ncbi:MAG: tyrosine-type recombinase/integrase [Acidimicrobiales bacterium]
MQRIAETIHPRFRALMWLGATSGLRFGELTRLTRRHVNLEARTLRVEHSLTTIKGQGALRGPPKSTAAHRTVAIPAVAVEALTVRLRDHVPDSPDAFVFTSVQGSPLLNGYFALHWKRALCEAGVGEATRFHDLRVRHEAPCIRVG